MKFNIVTLFPAMFSAMNYGIVGRAQDGGLIDIACWNPRDYTEDDYRNVDDSPYGGGPGMVMLVAPLKKAIQAARIANMNSASLVVYLTPQGRLLNHSLVQDLALQKNLILVSGRYEGIDERLLSIEPGIEVSIGDYVLSGGELAAMVIIDAVARQMPGVVGDHGSVEQDSFYGGLLDHPHYTRPDIIDGYRVPDVLRRGNHAEISNFRKKQSLGRTWLRRPELLEKIELTVEDRMLLNEFIEDS